jgi:hypothetical protein
MDVNNIYITLRRTEMLAGGPGGGGGGWGLGGATGAAAIGPAQFAHFVIGKQ